MPLLSNAQNLTINGGQFTDTTIMSGPSGIDILLEASCPEATHDAASREYPPRCFPGTREQYIQDIVNWAIPTLGDNPTPVYWMKGPAGVGKSAVAQTCAEELKGRNKLGAAFFFSISGRKKPEKFFPSIAYQLSTIHPPYHDLIDEKIRRDRTLVKKAMSFQFRYLIDEPLRELGAQGKGIGKRIAVIVDGLDECEGEDAQCEIIRIIASATSGGALPLCWAFFSRPEPHIEVTFARSAVAPNCHKVILPISRDADEEIELYLRNSFDNIVERRKASTQPLWPSAEDMEILVGAASGLFIYAATVIRFVDHLGSLGPQKRLCAIIDIILDHRNHDPHTSPGIGAPFAGLDTFYMLILQRIPTEIFPSVHLLLAMVCRWGGLGTILGANILGLSKGEFEAIYNHTNAVIHLQDPGKDLELGPTISYGQVNRDALVKLNPQILYDLGGRASFYHKSFSDFLLDPKRSGRYCVKGSEALAKHYLKMHLDYDRTYCWEGSKLVLTPGVLTSSSSLSYPYTDGLVNILLKARVYIEFGIEDSQSYSTLGTFGTLDANRDFRKHLYVAMHFACGISSLPRSALRWGCKCRIKSYPGTGICWISLAELNVNEFKLMIKRHKQAHIIRRYHPKWPSRIRSLFCDKSQEDFESALYCMGRGGKSIFWYWEINYELGHFRTFKTIDLVEGKKRFQEEDFASWPEYGHEFQAQNLV